MRRPRRGGHGAAALGPAQLGMAATAVGAALALAAPPVLATVAETPATVDTTSVQRLLQSRQSRLDSLLLPSSVALDTAGVQSLADSLDRGGAVAVRAQARAVQSASGGLDFTLRPLALTTYNRVEGLRLGAGGTARWGRHLRGDAAVAYGFGREAWSARAGIEAGPRSGPVARVEVQDETTPFGPTPEGESLGFLALVAGQDRRDYLRRRGGAVELWPWRRDDAALGVRFVDVRESSVAATTDFCLPGTGSMEDPNPAVDEGRAQTVALRGSLGDAQSAAALEAEAGAAGGAGDFQFTWGRFVAAVATEIPGGRLSLRAEGALTGGSPPLQHAAYLGGDATLRGYDRLEFAGRQRASCRIEYASGIDPFARARVPLLEHLHLQFIPFFDAGTTWGTTRQAATTWGSLEGEPRSSAGLGLQRVLWLPGLGILRLDVARRTDRGDDAWTWWLRVIPWE